MDEVALSKLTGDVDGLTRVFAGIIHYEKSTRLEAHQALLALRDAGDERARDVRRPY